MLMHSKNHLWNRGAKNGTQKIVKLDRTQNDHQNDIDSKLSKMKAIYVRWLISLYDKLRNSGEMIKPAFKVMEAIYNKEIPDEDPFKHLSE